MSVSAQMMKGTVVPVTLKLLAEREMYGYEILQEVNERTGDVLAWKEATLYPWLHRLENDGLIHGEWRTGPTGRQRKYYGLTQRGAAELKKQVTEWQSLSRAVSVILTPMWAA